MKNIYINKINYLLKSLSLAMIAGFLMFSANAQTIDPLVTVPPAVTYYTGDDTDASVGYTTTGTFDANTIFYLHTSTTLEEDNILGSSTGSGATETLIDFEWPTGGAGPYDLHLTAAYGDFNAEEVDLNSASASVAGGSYNGSTQFTMNQTGLRRITFQPLNTAYTEDVVLNLSFDDASVVDSREIVVQFSTDGTTYTNMTDTNADNEWFGNGVVNLQFELTSGQKAASVTFRILQQNSNSLIAGVESWTFDADDVYLAVGGLVIENDIAVGSYDIEIPETSITEFRDADDAPVGNYYAGQSIRIIGGFTGATGQIDDWNYVARFQENGNSFNNFVLESTTEATDGINQITLTGTIPANIEYDESWDVEILGHTTGTPLFGFEFMTDFEDGNESELTYEGGGDTGAQADFTEDDERSITFPAINVGTEANGNISFNLTKLSAGLSPAGTEVEFAYSTDGTTFTSLGEVSLNADLSETVVIDSWDAGVISSATIFKIQQKSNNGAGLSTWAIDDIELNVGGNVINNMDEIIYNTSSISVNQPTIVLEVVDVPDGLIYPGDEVDLTYNIINGAYPAGTTITAIFDPSADNPLIVGSSTLITPGDTEDHSITITAPAYVGGTYNIELVPSTDKDAESNSVGFPIYNTTVTITEVQSSSGVTDGGVEIIYPGDDITILYDMDGDIGSGAELMLEIFDYSDDVDDYVVLSSTTNLNGSITGSLPTGIDYDGGGAPMVRIKIGNGILAESGLTYAEDADGNDAEDVQLINGDNFFPSDLVMGVEPVDPSNGAFDNFIGSSERSATSIGFDYSFGGTAYIYLEDVNNFTDPQTAYLQGSIDGTNWITLDEEEFGNSDFELYAVVPAELWSESTQFRFIYNEDGQSGEFENEIDWGYAEFEVNQTTTANSDEYDISGQFRKPSVRLENLDSYSFITGESLTIEYTTEGPFPANTAFAIVLEGPDDLETVIGEGTGFDLTSVDVTMPSFAFEDNPVDTDELYNGLKVVAFDKATPTTTYTPDETTPLDDDEFFLIIEGTDEEDGTYTFDQAGDRSLLTDAFDLSSTGSAVLNFTISGLGVGPDDNILTIPVLQVSTDGGSSFTSIPAEEDGLLGDGYLFNNTAYSTEIDASFLTAATHFRWYQALNLGVNTDQWTISGISLTLVTGNEITTFYTKQNSGISSTLAHPSLAEFVWEQVNSDTDPVFNGEDFTYEWDQLYETSDDYPSGTQFDFVLYDNGAGEYIIDPTTDRPYIIGSTTAVGSSLTGTIPFFVEEGTYEVRLIASIDGFNEGMYFYAGDANGESTTTVGSLDVFLRALKTTFTGDPNATNYAGNDLTFSLDLENDDNNSIVTTDFFANLIMEYSGDDWLMAAPQDLADITIATPPFVSGNATFRVELSENAPLGTIGEIIDNNSLKNLDDGSSDDGEGPANFINAEDYADLDDDYFEAEQINLLSQSGRRMITTRDFEVGELSDATLLSFDLNFDQLPGSLTNDQYLIFEYSIDGGVIYNAIQTYPEMDAEDPLNFETFTYMVTADMQDNPTRFRWRQEESKGSITLDNVGFTFGEVIPFDYISENVSISPQAVLISSIDTDESCIDGTISINYEIRGRFGADNLITVDWATANDDGEVESYEFNLTEGTGMIDIILPEVLADDDDNTDFKFKLYAYDETNEDFTYDVIGAYSEEAVEVIAPINLDAEFSVDNQQVCDQEDIIVNIDDVQNYFTYDLINLADGTSLGMLTYDPEVGETEINIGTIVDPVEIGLVISSGNAAGVLSCNTLQSTYTDEVVVLPNYRLQRDRNYGTNFVFSTGETEAVCAGDDKITLRAGRINSNSSTVSTTTNVEWFVTQDATNPPVDFSTPVATGGTLSEFYVSGNYFGRVTDGDCVYTTDIITLEVSPALSRPAVTFTGDLLACEGAIDVQIDAPEGFIHYLWSNGETTRVINVDEAGSYSVRVSNVSFDIAGCTSPSSEAIVVEEIESPIFEVLSDGPGYDEDLVINTGSILRGCETVNISFFEEGVYGNNGIVIIYQDGTQYASTTSNSFTFTESGNYSAERLNSEITNTCGRATGEFTIEIFGTVEQTPVLTTTDNLIFCEGDGEVTLTAPAGFAAYIWYRNGEIASGSFDGFDASVNTWIVSETGIYSVSVGNSATCQSPISNVITVIERPAPALPGSFYQSDVGCGSGEVGITISNNSNNPNYTYQLVNRMTDETSGNAVHGADDRDILLVSDPIEEITQFYIRVEYRDGSSCINYDKNDFVSAEPDNVVLELTGTTLYANVTNWTASYEVKWYRNEVELINKRGDSFINVTDNATYAVVVEFENGCSVTSNSIDLGTPPVEEEEEVTGFVASTYPNPSSDMVNVNIAGMQLGEYTITLMTITGQVVISETVNKNNVDFAVPLDIRLLEDGLYNLRVSSGNEFENIRIFKK